MGVMDKFLESIHLNVPDDDLIDDEGDEIYDETPRRGGFFSRKERFEDNDALDFADDEDDDTYSEPEEVEEEIPVEEPVKKPILKKEPKRPVFVEEERYEKPKKKAPIAKPARVHSANVSAEVCMVSPKEDDNATEIADLLLDGKVVVLNLEDLNLDTAQRIIDFASGACYTMGGNLQKISRKIFIVTPSTVELSGDFVENISDQIELSNLDLNL